MSSLIDVVMTALPWRGGREENLATGILAQILNQPGTAAPINVFGDLRADNKVVLAESQRHSKVKNLNAVNQGR